MFLTRLQKRVNRTLLSQAANQEHFALADYFLCFCLVFLTLLHDATEEGIAPFPPVSGLVWNSLCSFCFLLASFVPTGRQARDLPTALYTLLVCPPESV
jgi:hypothetical protein